MPTSRIARKPITIPKGVTVNIQDRHLTAKGPKGQLSVNLHPFVKVDIENNEIKIAAITDKSLVITNVNTKTYKSVAGTVRAKINNLIHGVEHGFEIKLTLIGVGYRAQAKGKILGLSVGYSHPTDYSVPEGIVVETPSQTEVVIKGANKDLVGQVAAEIRAIRPPELYKGKGIRYSDEVIELKETTKK